MFHAAEIPMMKRGNLTRSLKHVAYVFPEIGMSTEYTRGHFVATGWHMGQEPSRW